MKHRFERGNQAARGHDGRKNRDPLRQVLISQLNEVDPSTGKAKLHRIVANLIQAALGCDEKITNKKGKTETIHHPPEAWAIREIWDRVEGKAPQAVSIDAEDDATQIGFIESVIVYPEGHPDAHDDDDKALDLKVVGGSEAPDAGPPRSLRSRSRRRTNAA